MKENEWVSVLDELPKIGKDILIKSLTRWNGEYTAQLNKESFCGTEVLIFRNGPWAYMPTHWKYPVEKRPDFSKLRKGDLVILELDYDRDSKVGYVMYLGHDALSTTRYKFMEGCSAIENAYFEIKKITRINLEEKTFEEI